jgi:phospholipid/cholesterol/gamma-HCH transport system permease protein
MIRRFIEKLGAAGLGMVYGSGYALEVLGKALWRGAKPRHPRRDFRMMVRQMYDHGVKAVPVVTLVAVFTGMIVAFQTGMEIKAYGQESMIGRIVAASMFREMGPFITGIILTATAGAACAAEIGTMRVSEEVDALEMMAIDPIRFLVVPRVAALALMSVVLTLLTNCFGTMGGALVSKMRLGVSYHEYFSGARATLQSDYVLGAFSKDLYTGLFKALVFGILIGVIGCSQGLRASGGALGVGRAVRQSVVSSVVLILILGYYLTVGFYGQ